MAGSTSGSRLFKILKPIAKTANSLPNQQIQQLKSKKSQNLASSSSSTSSPSSSSSPPVLVGTPFENAVVDVLALWGMKLRRCGGPGDGGVDLIGKWILPLPKSATSTPSRQLPSSLSQERKEEGEVEILVQCKGGINKTQVGVVREFEGLLLQRQYVQRSHQSSSSTSSMNTLGLLVSRTGFTFPSQNHALGASVPIVLVHTDGEKLLSFAANSRVYSLLPGLSVASPLGATPRHCVLMWGDEVLLAKE